MMEGKGARFAVLCVGGECLKLERVKRTVHGARCMLQGGKREQEKPEERIRLF